MRKPTVTITGVDALLVQITGQFNKALDERLFGKTSEFIKELDKASGKVFQAMATGAVVHGTRAYPAMGRYHSMPNFLSEYTEPWEPLSAEYLKRKKRLMQGRSETKGKDLERVKTTAYWEYKGELKRFFQKYSPQLTQISNNSILRNAVATPSSETDHIFTDAIKQTENIFRARAGYNSKGQARYDFTYNPTGDRPFSATYASGAKQGMPVTSQALSRIKREVEFDLFRGLRMHIDAISGKGSAPSPEDYIAGIQTSFTEKSLVRRQKAKGQSTYLSSDLTKYDKGSFVNKSIGLKLSYQKNGKTKYRGLVTPYMKYYAHRVLRPLARKLVRGI